MVTPVTVREGGSQEAATLSDQSLLLPGDWGRIHQDKNQSRFLLPVGTHWVENDVLGIADEVRRISRGKLRVASCSCGKCIRSGHFPHVVVEIGKRGGTYPVFGFTRFGRHVIQRVRQIHVSTGHHKKEEKKNKFIRKKLKQKAKDIQTHKLEVVEAALKSNKQDYRGPEGMKTDPSRTRL